MKNGIFFNVAENGDCYGMKSNKEKCCRAACKWSVAKGLLVLLLIVLMPFVWASGTNDTGIVGLDECVASLSLPEIVKEAVYEIKGNAIWDLGKLGLKVILIPFLLLYLLMPCVRRFFFCRCDGWRFIWSDHFAYTVNKRKEIKRNGILDFVSEDRDRIATGLFSTSNKSIPGVFVLMGPNGSGKRTIVRTKCNEHRHTILSVPWRNWYSGDKNAPITKTLYRKIKFLFCGFSWGRHVYISLEWSKTSELPSYQEFVKVITDAQNFWKDKVGSKRRLFSFVFKFPAYFWIDSLHFDQTVSLLDVNMLNCDETGSLADAAIKWVCRKDRDSEEKNKACRTTLTNQSKLAGVSVPRFIWVNTLGNPRQIVAFIGGLKYRSADVWKDLIQWWERAFNPKSEEERGRWFSLIYLLALSSSQNGHAVEVDLEKLSAAVGLSFANPSSHVVDAIKRLISDGARARHVNFKRFDAHLLFNDEYVRNEVIRSFGAWSFGTDVIVDFSDVLRLCMQSYTASISSEKKAPAVIAWSIADAVSQCGSPVTKIENLLNAVPCVEDIIGGKISSVYSTSVVWKRIDEIINDVAASVGVLEMEDFIACVRKAIEVLQHRQNVEVAIDLIYNFISVTHTAGLLSNHWGIDFQLLKQMALKCDNIRMVESVLIIGFMAENAFLCKVGKAAASKGNYENFKKALWGKLDEHGKEFLDFMETLHREYAVDNGNTTVDNTEYLIKQFSKTLMDGEWEERVALLASCAHIRFDAHTHERTILTNFIKALDDYYPVTNREHTLKLSALAAMYRYIAVYFETPQSAQKVISDVLKSISRWQMCPAQACANMSMLCTWINNINQESAFRNVAQNAALALWKYIKTWEKCLGTLPFSNVMADFSLIVSCCRCNQVMTEFGEIWHRFWGDITTVPRKSINEELEYMRAVSILSNTATPIAWRSAIIGASWRIVVMTDEGEYLASFLEFVDKISDSILGPDKRYCYMAMIASGMPAQFSARKEENIAVADDLVSNVNKKMDPSNRVIAILNAARGKAVSMDEEDQRNVPCGTMQGWGFL